jgi:hypothetical protein
VTRETGKKPKFELPTLPEFKQLVQQANAGDPIALAKLRKILDDNPTIWQTVGDLGLVAENSLIELISGGNQLVRESLQRKVQEHKQDLTPVYPSALEKLAVQRVITTWLECEYTTTKFPEPKGATLGQQRLALKLKDSAARRYDAAMKSLLLIQKLLPGHPQVDVGDRVRRLRHQPPWLTRTRFQGWQDTMTTVVQPATCDATDISRLHGCDVGAAEMPVRRGAASGQG